MALAYYASRGETPLRWGGGGATALGLDGPVSPPGYEAVFGPGGARHPETGERLVSARRPGMELVISAHKSVAELGVIGRAEHMHLIMDAERHATLSYLDHITRTAGGRRGRQAAATATGGLVYAHTRHATSRAGDPCPHDHVLLANVVEMRDGRGGWKAADTALWREHLHAATVVGRVAAARVAVELGYAIQADPGPSGRLKHWRIAGVPDEVTAVHSKRAAEISAECDRRGDSSYRARGVAARATRAAKEPAVEGQLTGRWRAELASIGWPVARLAAGIDTASQELGPPAPLTMKGVRQMLSEVLAPDGELARRKVFARRHMLVELAPHLYGQDPKALDVLADRALQDPEAIPLVGVAGARERPYALASVLATEQAIAAAVARQLERTDAPAASAAAVQRAIMAAEQAVGVALSAEQRQATVGICTSGRGAELIEGVAGSGKTTLVRAVAAAFEASGCKVIGTATSGQASRTLARQAEVGHSRTLASLLWRLDHDQLTLDERTAVILDEVGMTEDAHLVALTARIEAARAKLVLVGDHHQLGSVGPGGALAGLVGRRPDVVHQLTENRRQHNPEERQALAEVRNGDVAKAVAWYLDHDRLCALANRDDALQAAVDAWAADVSAGHDTGLYAWRRANVAALNQRARACMEATGRLAGPELVCPGGSAYRAGDCVVTLAPGPGGRLVTSQRAVIEAVDPSHGALVLRTDDGEHVRLSREEAGEDRLGYGYATTVHRSQGSTADRAHLFADGGGRELAYVGMSRARESTHVWTVADDLPQAVDDLRRDWSTQRTPTWAIDTAIPDPATLNRDRFQALPQPQQARVVALLHAETAIAGGALAGLRLSDRAATLGQAETALQHAQQARADLDTGRGVWEDTEARLAVQDLAEARLERSRAERAVEHATRWRHRHAASKEAALWAKREADAEQRWQSQVAPEITKLDQEIARHQATLEGASARFDGRRAATNAVVDHALQQQRHGDKLADQLSAHRDNIDGVPSATDMRRAATRRAQLQSLMNAPEPEPPATHHLGPEL
jgi:conjugative relaxase-like TrwC/TraI family protein